MSLKESALFFQDCDVEPNTSTLNNTEDTLTKESSEVLETFKEYLQSQQIIHQDNQNLLNILPSILTLQNTKEGAYGRSYCKYGDMSIFFNLARKWDRIENFMKGAMKSGIDSLYSQGTPTETVLDTLVDLGVYALLWVGYMTESHPDLWEQFKKQNNIT